MGLKISMQGIFWSKESIKQQSFLGRKQIVKQDACLVYFFYMHLVSEAVNGSSESRNFKDNLRGPEKVRNEHTTRVIQEVECLLYEKIAMTVQSERKKEDEIKVYNMMTVFHRTQISSDY